MQQKPDSLNPSGQKRQKTSPGRPSPEAAPGSAGVSVAARNLNAALLDRFPGRTVTGNAILGLAQPPALKQYLLPEGIRPESRLIVHPVRSDPVERIAALSGRWPDPMGPGIDRDEVLRATAPPAVLAWAGATATGDPVSPAQMSAESAGTATSGSHEFPPARSYGSSAAPLAGGLDIPVDATDVVFKAAEALVEGDWKVSWSFGTVTVDMSPESCRLVAGVAGAAAGYGGKKFIDSLFSGKPWYMLIIWGLIMADAGYVSYVLSDCAANNRRGRLYWSIFTGVFFATELPGALPEKGRTIEPAEHMSSSHY